MEFAMQHMLVFGLGMASVIAYLFILKPYARSRKILRTYRFNYVDISTTLDRAKFKYYGHRYIDGNMLIEFACQIPSVIDLAWFKFNSTSISVWPNENYAKYYFFKMEAFDRLVTCGYITHIHLNYKSTVHPDDAAYYDKFLIYYMENKTDGIELTLGVPMDIYPYIKNSIVELVMEIPHE